MSGRRASTTCALALLICGPRAIGQTVPEHEYRFRPGVNVGLDNSFVNLVDETHRWTDSAWANLPAGSFDARGWPASDATLLFDRRPVAEWAGSVDDPERHRLDYSGTYHCAFTGRADLAVTGAQLANLTYDADRNRTTFDLTIGPPSEGYLLMALSFTNTQRTPSDPIGSGITELRVIRPGHSLDTTQVFTDAFLACLRSADFSAIRTMGLTETNSETVTYPDRTTWSERKLPDDASQAAMPDAGKPFGAAWEHVIALANQVDKDLWINVPVSADEEYVRELARLIEGTLEPERRLFVESSNEVWNDLFPQAAWNQAQGAANGLGSIANHARRTVELAQIFESVFGPGSLNNRVGVMLCWHQPLRKWDVERIMVPYIQSTFGPVNTFIYSVASQTYFTPRGAAPTDDAATLVQKLYPGVDEQISEGPTSTNQAGRREWVQMALELGLPGGYSSYEGGPGTAYGEGSTTNLANAIQMHRHTSMKDAVKYNLVDGYYALGGNLYMHFLLSGPYTRYGCYGLTDDVTQPDRNTKLQAIREVIALGGR
jgi:hypothetical protein